ncbi:winged helix-turn-helix transcriptional regulator [Actinomycetospora endophytica]|uniref:winged helix-turn-helix transcriptional regulator n=1 Tax=Actinomycetospora endophytica TaxID=2291215 RepID=UPI001E388C85|nr:helix-turn-helix domain-containing protein [Actinomycetospora endophytica]
MRTYDHFCMLARALELVGDRWSLLVIRDLLSGAKRFTDLHDRLGGITPKTLTVRLRELEDAGVLTADRQPGRREVWYRLTPSGAELAPALDALSWWGQRHAARPPRPGERLHAEHLLRAITLAIEHTEQDPSPACWELHLDGGGIYRVACDGARWSLTSLDDPAAPPSDRSPDLILRADAAAFPPFMLDPSRAAELGVELDGDPEALDRFTRLVGAFGQSIQQQDDTTDPQIEPNGLT